MSWGGVKKKKISNAPYLDVKGLLVGTGTATATHRGLLLSIGRLRRVRRKVGEGMDLGVVDTAPLVRALGLVDVPFEVVVAHDVLHLVPALVLAANLALADAWAVPDGVALVLRAADTAVVRVARAVAGDGGFVGAGEEVV